MRPITDNRAPDVVELNRQHEGAASDPFAVRRYLRFADFIPSSSRVLDIGPGSGLGGRALLQRRPDLSLEAADIVPERLTTLPVGIYRAAHLYPDELEIGRVGRFDGILAGEVIEHVPLEDLGSFLDLVYQLLVPGGLLLLTTPNPHYPLLRWRGGSVLGGPHVSVHCHATLCELLRSRGFHSFRAEGTGKLSRFVGRRLPVFLYGSFLVAAHR